MPANGCLYGGVAAVMNRYSQDQELGPCILQEWWADRMTCPGGKRMRTEVLKVWLFFSFFWGGVGGEKGDPGEGKWNLIGASWTEIGLEEGKSTVFSLYAFLSWTWTLKTLVRWSARLSSWWKVSSVTDCKLVSGRGGWWVAMAETADSATPG